jgi:uracil-DNA glycosylase
MPAFDPGPDQAWEQLFHSAPLNHYAAYAGNPFHTRFGPVFYRGRLDGTARVLVVGQDPSTDEVLAQRIFVGQAGQVGQHFLAKIGLTRSYLMFNTFLFGVQSGSITPAMVTDATIKAFRNKLFDKARATNALEAVITFGSHARTSVLNWPGRAGLTLIHLTHPTSPTAVAANWNSKFAAATAAIAPDGDGVVDPAPYSASATAMPHRDIPRGDLPFGIPDWHGTGGATRSKRGSGANYKTQISWTAA